MQKCRDALGPENEWKLHAQPQIRYLKHAFEAQGTSLKKGQKSKSQKIEKWCEMLSSGMAAIKISNSQSLGDLAPGLHQVYPTRSQPWMRERLLQLSLLNY